MSHKYFLEPEFIQKIIKLNINNPLQKLQNKKKQTKDNINKLKMN